MSAKFLTFVVLSTAAATLLVNGSAFAKTPPPPWSDVAELSYVLTAGNSKTNTFGFKNVLEHHWDDSAFVVKAGAIRASSTTTSRLAVGTPDSYAIDTHETTQTTAEFYYLNARFDHKLSARLLWFVGGGWDRNLPSGIQNRYLLEAGLGAILIDTDVMKFRTDAGVTYTRRDPVIESGLDKSFAGLRVATDFLRKIGPNATYKNTLTVDDSVKTMSDFRADMVNSLTVSMNKSLALKAALEWIYANKPSFVSVPFEDPAYAGQTVPFETKKLDTLFTTSLVVNF